MNVHGEGLNKQKPEIGVKVQTNRMGLIDRPDMSLRGKFTPKEIVITPVVQDVQAKCVYRIKSFSGSKMRSSDAAHGSDAPVGCLMHHHHHLYNLHTRLNLFKSIRLRSLHYPTVSLSILIRFKYLNIYEYSLFKTIF